MGDFNSGARAVRNASIGILVAKGSSRVPRFLEPGGFHIPGGGSEGAPDEAEVGPRLLVSARAVKPFDKGERFAQPPESSAGREENFKEKNRKNRKGIPSSLSLLSLFLYCI